MPRSKQFDREKILEKAMGLFWKKGFHATSINDLVDYLDISKSSMYDTFGGKDQLFREALQLYQRDNMNALYGMEDNLKNISVREYLENFFQIQLHRIEQNEETRGCFLVNTTTELAQRSKEVFDMVESNKEGIINYFTRVIKLGQDKGEISTEKKAQAIARHLYTFQNGLNVISKIEMDRSNLEDLIKMELDYIFAN